MKELIAALALALFLRRCVLLFTWVKGRSMLPTLQNGEWALVWRWRYLFQPPERGDVVICYYPGRKMKRIPFLNQPMVKRVIALPGETVEIIEGETFINGCALREEYLDPALCRLRRNMMPITLAEDEYFVMGDHRDGSNDSRRVGPICRKAIIGRVVCIFFPIKQIRLIKKNAPSDP